MNNLPIVNIKVASMTLPDIEKVRNAEKKAILLPQVKIETSHFLHAGLYVRTVFIPAGVVITGALIKIATVLIVSGEAIVYIGERCVTVKGYNVFPADPNRKQIFLAKTDVYLTMMFASNAATVEKAEKEFTDEFDMLITRRDKTTTEIQLCQV